MTNDTDRLEDRLRHDLAELADHALVSADAWSNVEERASGRRWTPIVIPVAAVAAAIALVLAVVAVVNAGDENTVAVDPSRSPFTLEATSLPSGFARATFEDDSNLVCSRLEVVGGEPECREVTGSSSAGYRSDDPDTPELFVAVTVGKDTPAFEIAQRALDDPEEFLADVRAEADRTGGTVTEPSLERVSVRGDDNALYSKDESSDTVMWREAPGVIGTVDAGTPGDHLSVDELVDIAEGLRSVPIDTASLPIVVAEGPFPVDPDIDQSLFGELSWRFIAAESEEGWCTVLDQGVATTPCEESPATPVGGLSQGALWEFNDVGYLYGVTPRATATLELVGPAGEITTIEPADFPGADVLPVRFYNAESSADVFPEEVVALDVDGKEIGRIAVSPVPCLDEVCTEVQPVS